MADYITLVGAEEVSRAATRMSSAADDMLRAASIYSEAVDRLNRQVEDQIMRLERLMEEKPNG